MPIIVGDRLALPIDELSSSTDLIHLLRTSAELARRVAGVEPSDTLVARLLELSTVDTFATLAAVEALADTDHQHARNSLVDFLHHEMAIVRRHAGWRLGRSVPIPAAVIPLVQMVTVGGIDTLHAHRTLRSWSSTEARLVLTAIHETLPTVVHSSGRARLVDLMGVVEHPTAEAGLLLLAQDPSEAPAARAAAIGALGHRAVRGADQLLRSLAQLDDEIGLRAALALDDIASQRRVPEWRQPSEGLSIAQLTMAGELDRTLSRGGRGDTGGVASLLVSLGEAMARRPDVSRVLTIGRGTLTDAVADQLTPDDGKLRYASLAIGDAGRPAETPSQAWEHLPSIERGLSRALRSPGPVDLLHLRMADVGSLAGLNVATKLGIEICFSLAPDPHSVIQSLQMRGELDRRSFVERTQDEHHWFRARFVERLAGTASRLALFPRRQTETYFELRPSSPAENRRIEVVPEGIDVRVIRTAESELNRPQPMNLAPDTDILTDLAAQIPRARRHLPLLLSVGRLSPVKGMDRVASAWASDPALSTCSTLAIVGGSLLEPSPIEQSVLSAIDRAVPADHPARSGLVLLGGRPRRDIARLLVATGAGHDGGWAPGGVYVNGACKEEFGLALLEALAAGLVVVAPATGGPPTYVDDGDTGVLVGADEDLAPAVRRAFVLVDRQGRSERARYRVEHLYSIDTMADRLVDLYQPAPVLL